MTITNADKEVMVVETIQAAKDKTNELRKALHELVPICSKEPGCLQYELFELIKESGKFLILMRWKKFEDLTRHEASLTIQEFVQKYDKIQYGEVTQTEWNRVH